MTASNELGIASDTTDPEVVSVFLADTPAKIDELRRACEAGNSEAVRKLAHYLKGSAMYINARRMSSLCAQVQALASAPDQTALNEAMAMLDQECSRVMAELQQPRSGTL